MEILDLEEFKDQLALPNRKVQMETMEMKELQVLLELLELEDFLV